MLKMAYFNVHLLLGMLRSKQVSVYSGMCAVASNCLQEGDRLTTGPSCPRLPYLYLLCRCVYAVHPACRWRMLAAECTYRWRSLAHFAIGSKWLGRTLFIVLGTLPVEHKKSALKCNILHQIQYHACEPVWYWGILELEYSRVSLLF